MYPDFPSLLSLANRSFLEAEISYLSRVMIELLSLNYTRDRFVEAPRVLKGFNLSGNNID